MFTHLKQNITAAAAAANIRNIGEAQRETHNGKQKQKRKTRQLVLRVGFGVNGLFFVCVFFFLQWRF